MTRALLERFLSHWHGPALRIRYWDGRERAFGSPPVAFTVTVRTPRVLPVMVLRPSIAFGEAYTRGDIEVEGDLAAFLGAVLAVAHRLPGNVLLRAVSRLAALPQRTSSARAVAYAQYHYDRGNDFYTLWLDPTLTYSCAFFRSPDDDIATAQRQKLELLCRKLALKPGQTLLDIGCGWGSLLFHAVEHYGVRATGVTPSKEQAAYVDAEIRRRGLQGRCVVERREWRECRGTYDRIVSVGMFEHVGRAQYRAFFERWQALLSADGVSVLHTIGRMHGLLADPWIRKYIFPGGDLPALGTIVGHLARAALDLRDVENLRSHYALTLDAWSAAFAARRTEIVAKFGEEFARMWWLYLRASAVAFRYNGLCLWQIIITKDHQVPLPLTREAHLRPFTPHQSETSRE